MKMQSILYVIPDIARTSGGPRTRISMFKKVFEQFGDDVVMAPQKTKKTFKISNIGLVYVESATNRVAFADILNLCYLRIKSQKTIVFIRDIYIELFPSEYRSPRKRITRFVNKLSNFFLVSIAYEVAFPTEAMGKIFFEKNRYFPKRKYFSLPPGCVVQDWKNLPDFSKKPGILYMGSVSYTNAGFENYLKFSDEYKDQYRFFVLSGDPKAKSMVAHRDDISVKRVAHTEIQTFVEQNNIAIAFHTRPRNDYDDITFPIKVLDYISLALPFMSAAHTPLIKFLGKEYGLFVDVTNPVSVHQKIQDICREEVYSDTIEFLGRIAVKNSYVERYKTIVAR